ncbi:MAG: BspA family leucine-rich repeat surface protein [Hornefia butyriciproducens]|uniref:BspA family leucine-rich repeat surface protein n=1 Tax=Hornefia butyriciproducens TaxID=2652293 RepID=UPI002A758177|nr:BspA family leucine-rich repeat surface protein [Hornefia butyriciproducens]MDY2990586.1 BspA family leucine-rich repeat surface protein [Hornefia butyriciproducens]
MAIATGKCGTCTWTIADNGAMTIGAGTLHAPWIPGIMSCGWPWGDHVKDIKSCTIASGVVVGKQNAFMGDYMDTSSTAYMFYGCSEMTSLIFQGTFNTSDVSDMSAMFYGCSSLTSLDLSAFDTRKVTDMGIMFSGCSLLTSVTFGALFDTSALTDNVSGLSFVGYGFPSVTGQSNNIIVTSDRDFRALTKEQHQGTWVRSASGVRFLATAVRSDGKQADEDGEDVMISVTWLTGASTTERTIRVYKKVATDSGYPSTPDATETLTGNSGNNTVTIDAIGDEAFDFKVEFYDGTNTYIAFPSVASNVRLVAIDDKGCVEIGSNMEYAAWCNQRDVAAIRRVKKVMDAYMYPILDALTQLGDWAMATYGEHLWFSYMSNENYESETNTQGGYIRFGSNGSIAPSGKYMSGSNALFVTATVLADNKSLAKTSTSLFTFSIAKSGYTPIAIRGFDLDNASSSGANVAYCSVLAAKIKDASTAEFQVRNNHSAAAKIKLVLYVTYIATAAL